MTHPKVMTLTTACGAALLAGAASAQTACGGSYEIEPGDTLYTVSQECRIGLSRIMDLNPRIDPRDLAVGQTVELTASAVDTTQTRSSYRVEQGDTAFSIAQSFGIGLMELLNENEDLDPLSMAVGQALDIPTGDRNAGFTITPKAGPVGSEVQITARNLRPDDWVSIGVGRESAEWRVLEQAQVAADGEMRETVQVPGWTEPGDTLLFVVDTDRGMTLKSDDFEVVARDGGREDRADDGAREIALEGEVRDGVECPLIETPDGDLYALTSDDIPFTEGEYVEIEGHVAEMSFCQQGQATIDVEALQEVDRG